MNEVYSQQLNQELSPNRPNWPRKTNDQIGATATNANLFLRKEPNTPGNGENTELNLVQDRFNKSLLFQLQHQHPLQLVPERKRLKQCGTSKVTGNNVAKGNSNQQKKGGGGSGRDTGGAGPSKPTKDFRGGNNWNNDNHNNNDNNDDDSFDLANEETHKTVDTQCAQCDDGGFLIECIGRCRRSFHVGIEPEEEAGGGEGLDEEEERENEGLKSFIHFDCNVMKMEEDLAIALATSSSQLVCPSCLAYEQRCSYCGKLDEEGTKVRPCLVASCGHFYHPSCMNEAKRNLSLNHTARSLKDMCPLHWCCVCKKQGDGGGGDLGDEGSGEENNNIDELVQCRRCPTAYHRGCIPSSWNGFEGKPQRAWMADFDSDGNLLPGCTVETSMLYCEEHELDSDGVARQKVPLFSNEMLKAWALHYAKEFPHLESSKKLLQEKGVLGHREALAMTISRPRQALAGGEASGKGPSSSSRVPETIFGDLDAVSMRVTTENDAINDARRMLDEAKIKIDIAQVKAGFVQPYPYRNRSKNTIDRGVLSNLEATMQYVERNTSAEDTTLTTLIRKADIEAIDEGYRFLSYYLSPYIYPATYHSFGRIFMKKELIKHVVGRLSHLLRNGDCVVDLNCGKNEFLPLVKEVARKDGIVVTTRAFDDIVPKDLGNYVRKSWKRVTPESDGLTDSDCLVIGLKPPHSKGIRLSNAYIEHCVTFSPRMIILVVPLESIIPNGYTVILEDRQICNVRDAFYDPSTNRQLLHAEVGDHVFRVLVRSDLQHSIFETIGSGGEKYWDEIPIPGVGR